MLCLYVAHVNIFLTVAGHWYKRTWWNSTIHWYMHYQCLFWDIWCPCSRWNCWRHFLDVPGVHSGHLLVYYCTLWYLWILPISPHFTFHDMSFFVFSVLLGRPGCIRSSNISFEINYKGSIWGLTKWSSKWSQYVLILSTYFAFLHNWRDNSAGLCVIWSTYADFKEL
jgi:hypothetical protein